MFLLVIVAGAILGCFVVAEETVTISNYKKGADVVIDQIISNIKDNVAYYNPPLDTLRNTNYYTNPYNPNPLNTNFTDYHPSINYLETQVDPDSSQTLNYSFIGYYIRINVQWQLNGKTYSLDRYTYIAGGD